MPPAGFRFGCDGDRSGSSNCGPGLVWARRGDPSCWPLLDEAWDRATKADDLEFLGRASATRAEAAWLEGRAEAIDAETETTYDLRLPTERAPHRRPASPAGAGEAGLPVAPPDDVPERFRLQLDGFEAASELLKAEGANYDDAVSREGRAQRRARIPPD